MVAGSGLCVLVAAHLIMVHVVDNSHYTTYNRTTLLYPPSPMQVRELATWTADSNNNNTTNNSNSWSGIASTTATLDVSPMDVLVLDQSIKVTAETDKVFQSIPFTTTATTITTSSTIHPEPVSSDIHSDQIQAGASEATNTSTTASIAVAAREESATTAPTGTATVPTPAGPKTGSESTDSLSPLVYLESRNYPSPGYHQAGIHLLLFLAAQTALLVLLTTLFLGVLIMTEFVLDREDENEDVTKARWYFWGRVLGVITATVASAVHGSFLSAYVLLDGQSDCVAKAVVGSILFYWIGMIAVMNRTTGPLPY
ncbi:hypothetical protein KI688_010210 [Linnemannia hyalina]|uniref:Uncharacterized protein n=1 Tax=Linnemannia hyalina TaxID=64524 RepID=A0A9P8BVM4_9FUNG|nr:hypothetical protein KI688_010210 [Linnemannia hyalina]